MGDTRTIASFFSGYGGLEMGIRSALGGKCRTIVYVEREIYAVANLASKIEQGLLDAAPIHTDVTSFPYRKFRGFVDIACGGVPCQPHSVAGKRKGGNDERFLFDSFFDGLAEMQPGQIFIENVEGLLTSKMPDGSLCFRHIIERLEKMDYRVEAGLFTAAEVGAPHRRKRVFILANARRIGQTLRQIQTTGLIEQSQLANHNRQRERTGYREIQETNGEVSQRNDDAKFEQSGSSVEDSVIIGRRWRSESRGEARECGLSEDKAERSGSSPEAMANTYQPRSQGRVCGELPECSVKWPARPGSSQYDWEEPRVVKSELGLSVDGTPKRMGSATSRVDELRLLGNGVVPQQAARAYQVLSERINRI